MHTFQLLHNTDMGDLVYWHYSTTHGCRRKPNNSVIHIDNTNKIKFH